MRRLLSVLLLLLFVTTPQGALAFKDYLLPIEPFFQADYDTVLFTWEGEEKSVATSGCGAACVAMVQGYLTPDKAKTPDELLLWAYENDRYAGNGISMNTIVEMLNEAGIEATFRNLSAADIRFAIRRDRPVIVYMREGDFSDGGHYMVITGIDGQNRLTVIDPNSAEKSEQLYAFDTIDTQTRGNSPYIVCRINAES